MLSSRLSLSWLPPPVMASLVLAEPLSKSPKVPGLAAAGVLPDELLLLLEVPPLGSPVPESATLYLSPSLP